MMSFAEIIEPVNKQSLTGWTSVISGTGCYIRTPSLLRPWTLVQLRIARHGETFETLARVVRTIPGDGIGLAFLEIEKLQKGLLARWIEEIEIEEVENN